MIAAINQKQNNAIRHKNKVNLHLRENEPVSKKANVKKIASFSGEAEMLSYIDDIGAYIYRLEKKNFIFAGK